MTWAGSAVTRSTRSLTRKSARPGRDCPGDAKKDPKEREALAAANDTDLRTLNQDGSDLIAAIRYLISISRRQGNGGRYRSSRQPAPADIGELVENQCRIGLARAERLVRERMTLFDPQTGTLARSAW